MTERQSARGVSGRSRGMAVIAGVALGVYLLLGLVGSVSGSEPKEAWLYPLPVILAVGLGMTVVRRRRG